MLVKNNVKDKLLEMKEKLLEVAPDKQPILAEYSSLAKEVDSEIFSALLNKVENTNLHDLSLPMQLATLDDIAEEYEDVYEIQCGYQNTYHEYTDDDLKLSDLGKILIDNINSRRNIIQGYLINNDSIDINKKEIEKLNSELIDESKKKRNILKKYSELEDELKNNFLLAEGRNYDDAGNLVYNSIITEYQNVSLNLKELLADNNMLDDLLSEINDLKISSDEKLRAAQVCYERIPTAENKEVLTAIKTDCLRVNYKLVLLCIANLISKKCTEYKSVVVKREQIISLNEERLNCLRQLGVKIAVDPFSKIRTDEQIRIIKSLGDNSDRIEVIKRNICYLDSLIDDRQAENEKFALLLQDDIKLLRKDQIISESVLLEGNGVASNKVIDINDLPKTFNRKRAKEKTTGVITRVFGMLNESEALSEPVAEVNPTLVVEAAHDEAMEPVQETVKDGSEVFIEEVPFTETTLNDLPDEVPRQAAITDDIFSDNAIPFAGATLFDGKRDDDIFEDDSLSDKVVPFSSAVADTPEMPEVFWPEETITTDSEAVAEEDNIVNFDEQVASLIGNNNDDVLVKRKVA